ncbi:DUF2842 domain-containing protein [Phenylobacterium sp.]|jgi:hypothetical protein|uniref:DUF2842 domain-containing protein n=1 Tax=Phenylobacterium sp. TaxID=1871053 RepID=UPI0025FA00CD|nr:DUF2842 domain-containing protein [Phenylobacterium sp.]MCA3722204.1 DUF2842 domain-containing protein [Phenylobacterium sp.]
MQPRLRSFIGSMAILAFMAVYIWAATLVADRLPDNMAIKMLFFAVAGLGWGVPILPLISWMNRGR